MNVGSTHSSGLSHGHHHRSQSLNRTSSSIPPFRLNVDALIGAEETDVDTGDKVAESVDLTVVSAYVKAGLALSPRPVSAPPEDIAPSRSPTFPDVNMYKAATLGRRSGVTRANSLYGNSTNSGLLAAYAQNPRLDTSATPSVSSVSINQSDSCSLEEEDKIEEEEEDQEFYI